MVVRHLLERDGLSHQSFDFYSEEGVGRFREALKNEGIETAGEFATVWKSGRRLIEKAYDHSRLLDA